MLEADMAKNIFTILFDDLLKSLKLASDPCHTHKYVEGHLLKAEKGHQRPLIKIVKQIFTVKILNLVKIETLSP